MADNEMLASLLGYVKRAPGAAVDWLAGGARSGADPTLALMRGDAADQPFFPTADGGGRIGAIASALSGPMMPIKAPSGGAVLGAGPAFRAVKVAESNPITRKPVFEMFDEAGESLGRVNSATDEAGAIANHQRMAQMQAERAANPPPIQPPAEVTPAAAAPERNNWRMFRGEPQADDGYLYHVTSHPNARQILKDGLQPTHGGKTFAGGAYQDYSKGKAFVTDPDGVGFWNERVNAYLEHNFDKPPALATLRIPKDKVQGLQIDELGTGDAGANAYFSTKPIMSRAPLPAMPQTEEQKRAAMAELLRNGGA